MNQTKIVLFICLVLIFTDSLKGQSNKLSIQSVGAKTTLFTLTPYNPRYRLGLELILNNHLGFSFDVGYGDNDLYHLFNNNKIQSYQFKELRTELKYLLVSNKSNYTYCAIEGFYSTKKETIIFSSYQAKGDDVFTNYEQANHNSLKKGLHYKSGINFYLSKKINLDIYLGIGFANRDISYNEVLNPSQSNDPIRNSIFGQGYLIEGNKNIFHAITGIKIGYDLYRIKN